MANNRKVQSEIDKLIKKIDEGKEIYDEVYEKFKEAPSQPLKERFEADLKKEIKKLQRLREQVKGFIQNPEVKDKRQMEEKRREIEEKMEDFKVCERETKTKAYSKEGLANARNDQSDTPLGHTQGWINDALSELKQQLETAEYDAQEAGGGAKKRRGKATKGSADSDDPRVVRLARIKRHILRLEQVLRMLTNEELEPAEVDEIEETIQDMIENNANDDYESDGDIYEPFALPEVSAKDEEEEEAAERERQRQVELAKAAAAALEKKNAAAAAAAKADAAKEAAGGRVIVMETKKKDDPTKSTPTNAASPNEPSTPLSKSKSVPTPTAAAAAPAAAATSAVSTPVTPATPATAKKAPEPAAAKKAPTPATPPSSGASATFNAPSAAALNDRFAKVSNPYLGGDGDALDEELGGELDDDMDAANDDTFNDDAMPTPGAAAGTGSLADLSSMTAASVASKGDWGKGRPSTLTSAAASAPTSGNAAQRPSGAAPVAPQPVVLSPTSPSGPNSFPASSNASPPSSGAAAGTKINPLALLNRRKEELASILRPLEVSSRGQPVATDVERIKNVPAANPATTPACFPDKPFRGFNNSDLLRKFDSESLFFIFYYQQSTYLQYLAAKELKRLGFRYHTKFHTWFQRHEKPTVTHDQYEQGSYIYFDYENGWCQRVKRDFQFKYSYLEDDLD